MRTTLTLWLASFLLGAAPVRAADCPVEGVAAVETALKSAPTCDAAMTIFSSCGFGSTIDVGLGGIVIEKCEAEFLPTLAASRRKTYARAQNACGRKYARETGSLYRSATSFCLAELAQKYAHRGATHKRPPAGGR
jgi:hypothetical protein